MQEKLRISKRAWFPPPPFIRVDALNKGEIPASLTVPRREHVAAGITTLLHLDELEGEINRSRCTCPRNGRGGRKREEAIQ